MEVNSTVVAFPLPVAGTKTNEVAVVQAWMKANPERSARAIVVLSTDARPTNLPKPRNDERWFWHTLEADESDDEKLDAMGQHIAACSAHCDTLVCVGGSGELNTVARFMLLCANSYLKETFVDDAWCAFDCDTVPEEVQDQLRAWMARSEERRAAEAKEREPCDGAHSDSMFHCLLGSAERDDDDEEPWCMGQMLLYCKAHLFGTEEQQEAVRLCRSSERLIELDQAIEVPVEDEDDLAAAVEANQVWAENYNRAVSQAKARMAVRSPDEPARVRPCCLADNDRLSAPYGTDSLYVVSK